MKKFLLYPLLGLLVIALFTVLFFFVRHGSAKLQIESEWQTVPSTAPDLETTTKLEILPLYENDYVSEDLEFGHGVSYLIRTDSATILMDLGHNPENSPQLASMQNLQALGIDWNEIDAVVISHPHPDHVGGVQAWRNKTVSFGDFAGGLSQMTIYTPIQMTHSVAMTLYSEEPTLISSDIATTGVISFLEVFPISLFDPRGSEQALVMHVGGQGLVLITGCGHPTLEKLVTRAEALYGQPVIGVVGGLHYGAAGVEDLKPHIEFLEARQPKLIALSPHDSGPAVIEEFQSSFTEAYRYIRVGETIQFP